MHREHPYLAWIISCKFNLHGRILWPKGSTPLNVSSFRAKLLSLWKSLSKWGITSLGKWYYEFSFSSLEDSQQVRSIGAWNLNPGHLKLFAWTKDFNHNAQSYASSQVWSRIYGLAQEYWKPNFFFSIGSRIGAPICTNQFTNKPKFDREFGNIVRVLVELNLKKDPIYRVLMERTWYAFSWI